MLDHARGIAILLMVATHSLEVLWKGNLGQFLSSMGLSDDQGALLLHLLLPLMGVGAPLFMMVMGMGTVLGRDPRTTTMLRRGATLVGIGLLLNALRSSLPALVSPLVRGQSIDPFHWRLAAGLMLQVDILQFAGLSLILLALLGRGRRAAGLGFGLLSLLWIANAFQADVCPDSDAGSALAGYVVGCSGLSYFPLASWFLFPFAGRLLAQRMDRIARAGLALAATCAVVVVPLLWLMWFPLGGGRLDYYHGGASQAVVLLLSAIGWIAFLGRFDFAFPDSWSRALGWLSRNILRMYVAHWMILGACIPFLGYRSLPLAWALAASVPLALASIGAVEQYLRWKGKTAASPPAG